MRRRHWLLAASALVLSAPAAAVARRAGAPLLAAAWDDGAGRHHAGWLGVAGGGLQVLHSIELPTRAHGVLARSDGSLVVVSRRPGEWMLKWRPDRPVLWRWSEPARRFNGHVVEADGVLLSTETNMDSGAGLVVRHDARSLEPLDEWPTRGIDPHALLVDGDGSLLVANGGVPTQPERGRAKLALERMDSSLVRLDVRSGELLGQWRLDDPRLSLRHLARHRSGVVGIALQSEHDAPEERRSAPLLALFESGALRLAVQPHPLEGYAGEIVATECGFVLSATRQGASAEWDAEGQWKGWQPLEKACALAVDEAGRLWAAGDRAARVGTTKVHTAGLRLDNHWARVLRVDHSRGAVPTTVAGRPTKVLELERSPRS